MNNRDREYIESRLLSPATEVGEAIERLRREGHNAEADVLLNAVADLVDQCRYVRYKLWYPDRMALIESIIDPR
jgi:hypothetical protein